MLHQGNLDVDEFPFIDITCLIVCKVLGIRHEDYHICWFKIPRGDGCLRVASLNTNTDH